MASPIEMTIAPRVTDLGDGFTVRRVLPFHRRRMVGPFIFFDHFGPAEHPPGKGLDVRPHPHIGLATVTYLFEGAIAHRDTVGSDRVIRPGAVNWMTAGRGIVHSERTPPAERAQGQRLHGLQTWVALPKAEEAGAPAFVHHPADTLPVFETGGVTGRVIAGAFGGQASPVAFAHPILYVVLEAGEAGGRVPVPGDAAAERAVYTVAGEARVGEEAVPEGQMVVLAGGEDVTLGLPAGGKVALIGGAPMDGPRFIDWNLVASDRETIETAKADWREAAGKGFSGTRFALPEGETEWIPLPD